MTRAPRREIGRFPLGHGGTVTVDDEFARVFRAAVAARGLSLERIRFHLVQSGHPVSIATLSYWQSGRSRPERAASRAALGTLEEILGLPRGELVSLVTYRRRRDDAVDRPTFETVQEISPLLERLVTDMGLSWRHGLQQLGIHDQIAVGRDRTLQRHVVRHLIRATEDGLRSCPTWHMVDDSDAHASLTALRHCRVGQLRESAQPNLLVAELILEQTLNQGDSIVIEYAFEEAGGTLPMRWWRRSVSERLREMHMQVHFHPMAIPLSGQRTESLVDQPDKAEPLVIRGTTLEALALDFGPGALGLRWDW